MITQGDKIRLPKGFVFKDFNAILITLNRARTVTVSCSTFTDIIYFTTGSAKYEDIEQAGLIARDGDIDWYITEKGKPTK